MAELLTFRPEDLAQRRRSDPGIHVVDVRTPGEFAARHIPGSSNVPLADLAAHRGVLAAAGSVALVCESGGRAGQAERQLLEAGFEQVHVLDGGVAAWEAGGFELQRAAARTAPWTLERQVRLVAGALVAGAVGLSVAWPPARFAAGAVGVGLVGAAVTDTCAMGAVLSRLPHNRRRGGDQPTVASVLTDATEVSA